MGGCYDPLVLDSPAHAHASEHRRDRGRLLRGDRGGPGAAGAAAPGGGASSTRTAPQADPPPRVDAFRPAGARAVGNRGGRDLRDVLDAVLRPGLKERAARGVQRWLCVLRRLSASSTSARALAPAATFSCWISR